MSGNGPNMYNETKTVNNTKDIYTVPKNATDVAHYNFNTVAESTTGTSVVNYGARDPLGIEQFNFSVSTASSTKLIVACPSLCISGQSTVVSVTTSHKIH